ncbi:MAG: sensor histidine kinase [Nitriliruptorales bacterium]|nr:sensor histidine kinase [Nitriliruptorales bacterium]
MFRLSPFRHLPADGMVEVSRETEVVISGTTAGRRADGSEVAEAGAARPAGGTERDGRHPVVPWVLWGVAVLLATAGLVFRELTPGLSSPFGIRGESSEALVFVVALGGMGALIIARKGVLIGWLLLGFGAVAAWGSAANNYADYVATTGSGPGWAVAAWLGFWPFAVQLGLLAWLFYTFPDGRLPSPRWRWPARVTAGAVAFLLAFVPWRPGPFDDTEPVSELNPVNPFGWEAMPAWLAEATNAAFGVLVLAGLVGGAVSLVFRYRRASGERRYQIKWLAYVAVVGMSLFATGSALGVLDAEGIVAVPELAISTVTGLALISGLGFPVAIGLAVFKYRLYDIDVVISKTLIFAGLAAFIGVVYVAIVAGVGAVIGSGEDRSVVLPVLATAVVGVAFHRVRLGLTAAANRLVFGDRASPYEVLSRFSAQLSETVASDEALQQLASLLADGTGGRATVSMRIGDDLRPVAEAGATDDAAAASYEAEVTHDGQSMGRLAITKQRGEALTAQDRRLVDDLAAQAGLLLRNVRLTEELKQKVLDLRDSRQRLVSAQDAERRRLERDLHDGAQQQIVAIKMKLGVAATLAEREEAHKTAELVEQLADETDDAVQTLRELAHGIYPPLLASEGLPGALRSQARKAAVPVEVTARSVGRYDQDVEAAIYFCVLEALQNAAKYGDPDHVQIQLVEDEGQLVFVVADDGAGFNPDITTPGHGMTNMADRLDALGGSFAVSSAPGEGTTVTGQLPVADAAASRT